MSNNDIAMMRPELTGAIAGLNPFKQCNSASRVMMDASHVAQAVVLENPDRMTISSGMDFNYADYIFDVRLEGEPDQMVRILKIFKKYSRLGGEMNIDLNPETYIIYENIDTNVIDVAVVPTYYFNHTTFGFKYIFTDALKNLQAGDLLEAGTVLATSPSYDALNEQYCLGKEAFTVYGSFPGVIEDGIVISESFAKKLTSRIFGTLSCNYGTNNYLLNLYGDDDNYRPFPEIGQKIRDDGLVFALRRIDPLLAPVQMTPKALRKVNYDFDQLIYGKPGAVVEDITVHHSHDSSTYYLPTDMKGLPNKYWMVNNRFSKELEKYFFSLKSNKRDSLKLSPKLHNLIVDCMKLDHDRLKRSNKVTYRKEELAQYRVEITYSKPLPMFMGHKMSGLSGDKGVVTGIWKDENMPYDPETGRRADVIAADGAAIHRMIAGRCWEHNLNAVLDQQREKVKSILELHGEEKAWEFLMGFYEIASPFYHDILLNGLKDRADRLNHIGEFIHNETSIVIPFGSAKVGSEHAQALEEKFPLHYGQLVLTNPQGEKELSKDKFLLAQQYFIRLEKIGEYWSSTSIPKRQHHGIISKLSLQTKTSLPYRSQSIRLAGETEMRQLMAGATPAFAASLVNMANNNEMCMDATRTILTAPRPSAIPELIDYSKLHKYPSIALERINHLLKCFGVEYYYIDEREHTHDILNPLDIEITDHNKQSNKDED